MAAGEGITILEMQWINLSRKLGTDIPNTFKNEDFEKVKVVITKQISMIEELKLLDDLNVKIC
jgi:hypothetical protein